MKLITVLLAFASPPLVWSNEFCEPSCSCIPDESPTDECPAIGDRQFAFQSSEDAIFFAGLEVNETSLFRFDPPGCQPFPSIASQFQETPCTGVVTKSKAGKAGKKGKGKGGDVQCSFKYAKGDICDSKQYRLVEEPAPKSGKKGKKMKGKKMKGKKNAFVTHEGACGVCSSAQDLAVNLSPSLTLDSQLCTNAAVAGLQAGNFSKALPNLEECYAILGFSPECRFLWASNSLNTLSTFSAAAGALAGGPPFEGPASCTECAVTCLADPTIPECLSPLTPGTCELSPCVQCDEDASGPVFKAFGGRTRRNSGIINTIPSEAGFILGVKRPCSTIANLKQPARICPVDVEEVQV